MSEEYTAHFGVLVLSFISDCLQRIGNEFSEFSPQNLSILIHFLLFPFHRSTVDYCLYPLPLSLSAHFFDSSSLLT